MCLRLVNIVGWFGLVEAVVLDVGMKEVAPMSRWLVSGM
jgi:hypothetical protein